MVEEEILVVLLVVLLETMGVTQPLSRYRTGRPQTSYYSWDY
jgi:hypothetical protein